MKPGSWNSPISAGMLQNYLLSYSYLCSDSCKDVKKNIVYWVESHPEENGRNVIISYNIDSNKKITWTPQNFNVRSTVHEYGGCSMFVHKNTVYFSNFTDQQLYKQSKPLEDPVKVSNDKAFRYADGSFNTMLDTIFIIREDHSNEKSVKNTITVFHDTLEYVLIESSDFYASPKVSNDGSRLAWIEWDFPNMPWDNTRCCVGKIVKDVSGRLSVIEKDVICTGTYESPISCTLPCWTNENDLIYIHDKRDYWNIWLRDCKTNQEMNLTPVDKDVGDPMWMLDYRRHCYRDNTLVVGLKGGEIELINLSENGVNERKVINLSDKLTYLVYLELMYDGSIILLGHSSRLLKTVYKVSMDGHCQTIGLTGEIEELSPDYISIPEHIKFPVDPNDAKLPSNICSNSDISHENIPQYAYGYYYPPKNPQYDLEAHLSPLLVVAHGGPTAAAFTELDLEIQYWTSRGFSVLDVDYRGSTGYGKVYRHSLRKKWGILDVQDCCSGVTYLAHKGLVDPEKVCILGGSAGGYLVLCCLTFTDVFKAGSSKYGIGDLDILAQETHKFESRYSDIMIGDYEKCKTDYFNRSPINFSDKINCPVIFFQGTEDKIVPKEQAITMYEKIKASNVPCSLVMYEGEQHGFRSRDNIIHNLIGQYYFFSKIFGFEMDNIVIPDPEITIVNCSK